MTTHREQAVDDLYERVAAILCQHVADTEAHEATAEAIDDWHGVTARTIVRVVRATPIVGPDMGTEREWECGRCGPGDMEWRGRTLYCKNCREAKAIRPDTAPVVAEERDMRVCRLHGLPQDDPRHDYTYPDCENAGYDPEPMSSEVPNNETALREVVETIADEMDARSDGLLASLGEGWAVLSEWSTRLRAALAVRDDETALRTLTRVRDAQREVSIAGGPPLVVAGKMLAIIDAELLALTRLAVRDDETALREAAEAVGRYPWGMHLSGTPNETQAIDLIERLRAAVRDDEEPRT